MKHALVLLICAVLLLFCGKTQVTDVSMDYTSSIAGKIFPAGIKAVVSAVQGLATVNDTCGSNGDFEIDRLKPGSCAVTVSAKGYGTYRTNANLTEGGVTQLRDITLEKVPYPVSSVSPSMQSEWNSINSTISIDFALPMDSASVMKALSISPAISSDIYWEYNYTELVVRPFTALRTGTVYTIKIDTSASANDNSKMEFRLVYTFTTEPFRISSFSPSNGQKGISLTQTASISFNAPASSGSVESALKIEPEIALDYSWNGNYLNFHPRSGYWQSNTFYTVTIPDSAKDLWGNKLITPVSFSFTTTGVEVTGIIPVDSHKNVVLTTDLIITFSAGMNKQSVVSAFSLTDENDSTVAGTFSWFNDDQTVYFYPSKRLKSSTRYTIALDTGALDISGSHISDTAVTFTTEPFKITSISPESGISNFGLSQNVIITFNGVCNSASVQENIYTIPSHPLTFTWSGSILGVRPQSGYWENNTKYKLVVKKAATDLSGKELEDSSVVEFSTSANIINSMSPSDNQNNVNLSGSVNISFMSSMDPATTSSAFTLKSADDQIVNGTFSWGSANSYFTFTPQQPLHPATQYTITIDSTATDLYGGKITPVTEKFSTEHMRVIYSSPANNSGTAPLNGQLYLGFNTAPDGPSVENAISVDPPIDLDFTWTSNYLYIKPRKGSWQSNVKYTVTIGAGAKDMWGADMELPYTYVFYTQPAKVVSCTPAYNQVSVALSPTISVIFNTEMKPETVAGALTVVDSVGATAVEGTISGSGAAYSFTPKVSLTAQTRYIITVDTTAKDLFGSALPVKWSSGFTTVK